MARILVADDDASMRAVLVEALTDAGHAVRAAASRAESIRLVGVERFDLLLTDLLGSPRDERTSLYLAALVDAARGMPVIVLTGWGTTSLSQAAAIGLAAILEKPIDLDDLLRELDAALTH